MLKISFNTRYVRISGCGVCYVTCGKEKYRLTSCTKIYFSQPKYWKRHLSTRTLSKQIYTRHADFNIMLPSYNTCMFECVKKYCIIRPTVNNVQFLHHRRLLYIFFIYFISFFHFKVITELFFFLCWVFRNVQQVANG